MARWTKLAERQADEIMADAEYDGERLTFLVPPACAGQAVEVAYAGIAAGIIERTTDSGSVSYRMRDWRDGDDPTPGLNGAPD